MYVDICSKTKNDIDFFSFFLNIFLIVKTSEHSVHFFFNVNTFYTRRDPKRKVPQARTAPKAVN